VSGGGGPGPVLAVTQHVPYEHPGLLATVASARGLATDIRRLDEGDDPPTLGEADGLIVMGGPMNADESDEFPWLGPERSAVRAFIDAGRPVLGVCLGAQLIARALDAAVFRGDGEEIGMGTVELTREGVTDPLLAGLGPELACFHWHGDTFELPTGATRLAGNDRYANQAFRTGSAWGLQFHVEVDESLASEWSQRLPHEAEPDPLALEGTGRLVAERFVSRVVSAR
jgi:GMP synthase (glutamine-hydrolysing)